MSWSVFTIVKKRWLSPAARWVLSWQEKRVARRGVDPRRFWAGEPLPAPRVNVPLFAHLSEQPMTRTFNKESRDSIFIKAGREIVIPLVSTGTATITVSIAYEGIPKLSEMVQVFLGDAKVAELSYIMPQRWHQADVHYTGNRSSLRIVNHCAKSVVLAHPIVTPLYTSVSQQTGPKNIIVLLLDSLSRDALGIYQPDMVRYTPNISRFFQSGLVYRNGFTQSEWTFPSIYSFLTSRYAFNHRMCELKGNAPRLGSTGSPTLVQQMQALGYRTFAYSTVKVFHPAFHGHLGFDRFFYDPFPQPEQTHQAICTQAIAELNANQGGKIFLFLHFLDTHEPWTHPDALEQTLLSNFRITDPMQEYTHYQRSHGDTKADPLFDKNGIATLTQRRNARLFSIDQSLQTMFDYLERAGQLDDTVVALFSDHGSPYFGQGRPLLCETRVKVPLLIRHPRISADTIDHLVAVNLDLGPTLMEIAGGTFEGGQGLAIPPFGKVVRQFVITESIYRPWYKAAMYDERFVYHYCCGYDPSTHALQLNRVRSQELFERQADDLSQECSSRYPGVAARMREQLLGYLHPYAAPVHSQSVK